MKPKIARSNDWTIPVLVDDDGNMWYQVEPKVKLHVVTNQPVELIDCADLHGLATKLKMAEMRIANLEKQVAQGYNADYLEKYFKEAVAKIPDLVVTQKIVVAYGDFLDELMFGKGELQTKNQALNQNKDIPHIERDLQRIKWFQEYLEARK